MSSRTKLSCSAASRVNVVQCIPFGFVRASGSDSAPVTPSLAAALRARRAARFAAGGLATYCRPSRWPCAFVRSARRFCAGVSSFHAASGRYRVVPRDGVPSRVRQFSLPHRTRRW